MQVRRICIAATAAALALGVLAIGAPGSLARATKPKIVHVKDNFYTPDTVRVKKRHRVRWKWSSSNFNVHNVTLKKAPKGVNKSKYRSQTAQTDFTFTKRFRKVGRYKFYCTIHPDVMRMTVRVHR
jgi:plastocyanin